MLKTFLKAIQDGFHVIHDLQHRKMFSTKPTILRKKTQTKPQSTCARQHFV